MTIPLPDGPVLTPSDAQDVHLGDIVAFVAELAPRRDFFHAEDAEFDRRLLDQMHRLADDIDTKLSAITPEAGAICLLCFEREVTGPESCHRRLVAGFLAERYGVEIPEMDPAPSGCR